MTLLPSGWGKTRTLYESPPNISQMADAQPALTTTQLHRLYLDDVYRYVSRRIVGREDAEDITAEVFAAAFQALPRFRGEVEPNLWLLGIARRKVADALRGAHKKREAPWEAAHDELPAPKNADPSRAVIGRERRQAMHKLLSGLKEEQREALLLKYVEELSIEEIAVVLGRSKAAANSLLQRARATVFRSGQEYFLDFLSPDSIEVQP